MEIRLLKLQLIYYDYSSKTLLTKIFFLATAMALFPWLNLIYPINNNNNHHHDCNHSQKLMKASDLEAAFHELITSNWLIYGHKSLLIGKDSVQASIFMRKLGFSNAIGVDGRNHHHYKLPLKKDSFDFVLSTAMIDSIRVPARMVVEMERVLRPASVGVVLRRVSGCAPVKKAVTKTAAPVGSYLKFSDIVGVHTVNCTVMVVFKKRELV